MSSEPQQKSAQDVRPGGKRSSRDSFRTGGLLALAVVGTLFAVLNVNSVEVNWVIGSGHAPLIVVIAVSVLIGVVLTYMADRINRRRRG
jgi:uncharacterized integral membrane protein